MGKMIASFFVVSGVMVLLDSVWLGLVAPAFYKKHIGFIMTSTPNWVAAGLFYAVFIVGLLYFVIHPLAGAGSLVKIALTGALFGIVTYATYDLTNLATLKNWPVIVTVVDMIWGATISAAVSTVSVLALRALNLA